MLQWGMIIIHNRKRWKYSQTEQNPNRKNSLWTLASYGPWHGFNLSLLFFVTYNFWVVSFVPIPELSISCLVGPYNYLGNHHTLDSQTMPWNTQNKRSSIWQLCCHWWHCKLSEWQLTMPQVTTKLSHNLTTLPSLVAPKVVRMTTYGATINDKVVILMTFFFSVILKIGVQQNIVSSHWPSWIMSSYQQNLLTHWGLFSWQYFQIHFHKWKIF